MGNPLIRIALLGSTGSIGVQTLDVVRSLENRFEVLALAAGQNLNLLRQQVREFKPRLIWASAGNHDLPLLKEIANEVDATIATMDDIAMNPELDLLVVGTSGRAGLEPTLAALERGTPVALANKEVVVMAGHLVRAAADSGGAQLRPIDSEHSAIWQCLWGEDENEIKRIILTASGGALRDLPENELSNVTPAQALSHPTWNMGKKITIDSATLLNKGMETIEARWLFDIPYERVEVLQHTESIVHSLVEMSDGSVKALSFPKRLQPTVYPLDLAKIGTINFENPNLDRYPCLRLAMQAGKQEGTYPAVLAAADEVAVHSFLQGEISFPAIASVIESTLMIHESKPNPDLQTIDASDTWARRIATEQIRRFRSY